MVGELQQKIDRVNAKTQILLDRYALIQRRRDEALARVAELETELEKMVAENQKLRTEIDFLKIATTIAPDRQDVARSREVLSELVREIDKCITELNE